MTWTMIFQSYTRLCTGETGQETHSEDLSHVGHVLADINLLHKCTIEILHIF